MVSLSFDDNPMAREVCDYLVMITIMMNDVIVFQFIVILIIRGFPVTSLPCNNTVVEVWNTNLKVVMLFLLYDDDGNGVCENYKKKYNAGASTLYDRGSNTGDGERAPL